MKPSDPWQTLTALARTAPAATAPAADPDDDARFAAAVVRRWTRPPPVPTPAAPVLTALPWEAWSLRGFAAAGVAATLMLAWNLPLVQADDAATDFLPPDPVAELAAAF